ncbi:MAG: alginate lyase family protein [Anaerolineae bacterium]
MNHCGLYFSPDDVRAAQSQQARPPLKAAFERLADHPVSGAESLLRAGFLWRFLNNSQAGEGAILPLERAIGQPETDSSAPLIDRIGGLMTLAQAYELLRDHPAFEGSTHAHWREAFAEQVRAVNAESGQSGSLVDEIWTALLNTAAGIVLDEPKRLQAVAGVFESVVRDEVRPQGHIARVVDQRGGSSIGRQILSASALVLIAEAAAHSGENLDLWSYAVRGVSAATAAIYPIYYFYTTEKWKWDADLAPETVQQWFRQHGGYLEIVYRRTGLKDVATVLEDLRPVFDAWGGGYTTISHGTGRTARDGRPRLSLFK